MPMFNPARVILGTLILIALVGSLAAVQPAHAQGAASEQPSAGQVIDPDASAINEGTLLRELSRIQGRIIIPDQRERVLEQPGGRVWDYFHEVLLHRIGAIVILGMTAFLAIFYVVVGPLRMRKGRSGIKVRRFNGFERFCHWLTATSFVLLALTGLNITFGKLVLRPVIGADAFSTFAQYAKYVHNYVSFAFVLGLVFIVAMWIKDNIPRKVDIIWLKEGGGFVPSKHPPAGRFNAGEKLVFWFAFGAGAAVAASGYLLMFPFYLTNIAGMQVAQVVHSLIAVAFIAVIIAHIYIGTLGTEGAFEAMGTGDVDLNWAKAHHDLWLEEEVAKGRVEQPLAATPAE